MRIGLGRRLVVGLLAGACVLAGAEEIAPVTAEVYSAGTMELDTFVATVRGVVGPEAMVVPDPKQHRVVVMTTPDRHRRIAELSGKLTAPVRNVRIDVAFIRDGEGEEREASVSGGGGVVIRGDGEVSGRVVLEPRLRNTRTTNRSRTVQTLVVASGGEAMLRVGESVPYLEWFTSYGPYGGSVSRGGVAWQDVGSFLAVQPVVLGEGNRIRVRVTPVLSGRAEDGSRAIRFAEAATEVTVKPGRTIDLGGLAEDREFYRRFLVGGERGRTTGSLRVELTPTLLDATGVRVDPP